MFMQPYFLGGSATVQKHRPMNTPRPQIEIASLTHAGTVRSHNKDSHAVDARTGFALLADGMGGYNTGAWAAAARLRARR